MKKLNICKDILCFSKEDGNLLFEYAKVKEVEKWLQPFRTMFENQFNQLDTV